MADRRSVPSLRLNSTDWSDGPPHPRDAPALYDGLLWRRVFAYLVDVVIIAVLSAAAWVAVAIVGALSFGLLIPIGIIVLALIPVTYHTYFIGSRGATPGMRLFDLGVVNLLGRQPDYPQALLVTVLFYVTVTMTASLILVVALFNDRGRTIHDIFAGTMVLRGAPGDHG